MVELLAKRFVLATIALLSTSLPFPSSKAITFVTKATKLSLSRFSAKRCNLQLLPVHVIGMSLREPLNGRTVSPSNHLCSFVIITFNVVGPVFMVWLNSPIEPCIVAVPKYRCQNNILLFEIENGIISNRQQQLQHKFYMIKYKLFWHLTSLDIELELFDTNILIGCNFIHTDTCSDSGSSGS